jgi:dipeptidyl aminopeptidase/acylaminoacyl peptidase
MIIHGEQDQVVPVQQAIDFDHALASAGVPSVLVLVRHAGHELLRAGGTPSPTTAQISSEIVRFFTKYLKS